MQTKITVIGAREHNLKNVTVSIPKDQLVIITGPSGSGKSSLALDILYVEGKRRYMESLSAYARQFLGIAQKPDFDKIEGLCPSIAIEQKTVGANPRSTVGTITEIYDYLRVLFARIGTPHCPTCGLIIQAQLPAQIAEMMIQSYQGKVITIYAPLAVEKKGEFVHEIKDLVKQGLYRFIIDGTSYKFSHLDEVEKIKLKKTFKHTIDVVVDAVEIEGVEQLAQVQEAVSKSFAVADNLCKVAVDGQFYLYSSEQMCISCHTGFPEIEPRSFSFNSPVGACNKCHGLGVFNDYDFSESIADGYALYRGTDVKTCEACQGMRLNKFALHVKIEGKNIYQWCELSIENLLYTLQALRLDEAKEEIAAGLKLEIIHKLQFLQNVGLGYLSMNRTARTLSGGEGQRIRLAKQVGSALCGVLYILDEPSIGLHQSDNDRLIKTLHSLRDIGNSVVVVEHDLDTMMASDYIIDMGPAAGVHGGQVIAYGTPQELMQNKNSLTGKYLSHKLGIPVPKKRRQPKAWITLSHARANNLKDITVQFPLGVMCGISGVSGSGKSSLIFQELVPAVERALHKRSSVSVDPDCVGVESIESMVLIDQSPIGRTSRSNPATYIGIFGPIRDIFVSLPESKARGYQVGQFSFNARQGRCYECDGNGEITVSMHFLPDVVMVCKVCKGKRYNAETLQITFKDKTIYDILEMTALEALEFFKNYSALAKKLQLLCDVGLDYIKLGQSSTTLSGGEAQRIKLVNELSKRGKNTLYILDEPTTGLHIHDISKLVEVLSRLLDKGNSMIIIEHNLEILKISDWIIDLGPLGGDKGGYVVASGTPEVVAKSEKSATAPYLKTSLHESVL